MLLYHLSGTLYFFPTQIDLIILPLHFSGDVVCVSILTGDKASLKLTTWMVFVPLKSGVLRKSTFPQISNLDFTK